MSQNLNGDAGRMFKKAKDENENGKIRRDITEIKKVYVLA